MNWHLVVAVVIAGTLGSLTDWLFMGVLFHARYNAHPEIWWPELRAGRDKKGIMWATALGYVSAAAIAGICALTDVHRIGAALEIAALAWLAGPFLVIVVNGFFIKIDPLITASHCAGYLARFLIAGLSAGIALK
ncbi:MAG: hypothetical protein ABSD74_06195 [Rhizomicrobium sp.]|jgi:hypothetical protein